ncbi:MAG: NADPH-dependent F420 reductase [Anaerolineales bacterium]|nr:NADPH-dependent F420 reductase [Anaerolineales bacterium]
MTKKIIAVLGGTGNEGPGLAMRWANAGYQVIIGSRQAEKAENIAAELNEQLGIDSITGLENSEAAKAADICVLTIVAKAHQAALDGLKEDLQGKIVVDATARVKFPGAFPPDPPSAARIAQDILGEGATVVAAYQNVPASTLRKDLDKPIKSDVLVCGEDMAAVEQVISLTEDAGMKAYFAGGLDNAFVVEGLTALLITMNKHYKGHGTIQIAGLGE